MKVSVSVTAGSESELINQTATHCILGGIIYVVDSAALDSINRALQSHVADLNRITGPEYVALLTEPALSQLLVDHVERNSVLTRIADFDLQDPSEFGLSANLYPYQVIGVSAMLNLARSDVGSLLGDEMGLGKTLQAIALMCFERSNGQTLTICPGSLIENWRRELLTFAPSLSVAVHHGPERRVLRHLFPNADVVITTYETASADIAFLEDISFNLVVIDEAQMIKNASAARALAVKRLSRRVGVAVTGTPVENSLADMWSLAQFVHPGLLGRLDDFVAAFPDDTLAAERLGKVMNQVTIRRSVDEVALELPALVEQWVPLHMDPETDSRYSDVAQSGSGLEVNTKLLVIASHSDDQEFTFSSVNKNEYLAIQLEQILNRNEKAIVFCNYRRSLERLRNLITDLFSDKFVEIIDGSTDQSDRQTIVDSFSSWPSGGVLLLNPRAAGVGLNITAANHVFHYSPNYNPAVTRQATKRAHRNRQTKPVFVHHLYYVNTVEERALNIADDKVDLALAVDRGLDGNH
jgi:SNF2 family DNA or RNA helicase